MAFAKMESSVFTHFIVVYAGQIVSVEDKTKHVVLKLRINEQVSRTYKHTYILTYVQTDVHIADRQCL